MQFIDKIVLKEKFNFILKDSNVICKVRVILVIFQCNVEIIYDQPV